MIAKDINPDIKPEALSDIDFPFPKYEVEKLKNGLKVYLIEDKEQPTIAIRILVKGGSSVDGIKSGVSEMTSSLLTKGTKSLSAEQIANLLDGVGASVSTNSGADFITIYAQSLKKHQQLMLSTLADVLLNPTFPKDEFEKLQKQMIAGVQYEKSNPSSIAQALARMAIYGSKHPYSLRNTEQSLNSILIEDINQYYQDWFRVNNATLAVIGDFDRKSIMKDLENHFGKWESGKVPNIEIPLPEKGPKGVYFVNRPGSVQSSVVVTTNTVPIGSRDYESVSFASNILGAFSGRLFNTLREKYSFTYTPFGFQTRTKFTNRFACGADVAAEKTDSSLRVILEEMNSLVTNYPTDDEYSRIRQYTLGSYLMAMDSSSYIASLIQNTDFYGLKVDDLPNYPKRLNSITKYDIKSVAAKYINPVDANIVVVGDPKIREELIKYAPVFDYDLDLNPYEGPDSKLEKVNLKPEKLIDKYIDAVGGIKNIDKVKFIAIDGSTEMNLNGQVFSGDITTIKSSNGKMYQKSDFRVFDSETWVDGQNAWITIQGQLQNMAGNELNKLLFNAYLFPELKFDNFNIKLNILGKSSKYILMNATTRAAETTTYYFDKDSYLLFKKEILIDGPNGKELFTETFTDYKEFNDLMLPTKITNNSASVSTTSINKYIINPEVEPSIFKPKESENK